MTKPVAYLNKYLDGSTDITRFKPSNEADVVSLSSNVIVSSTPLYTSEHLYPRVKMTQEQHRLFENYKTNKDSFYHFWQSVLADGVSLFQDISERDLMLAWLDEKTIEIVPDMKWFVRSKEKNGDRYLYLKKPDDFVTPWYTVFKDLARYFDTKEEAELWTNPLTEAVRLPVEGE